MLRRALSHVVLPGAVFFGARHFLGNGDALLVAAVVLALVEARRRWRIFQASAAVLSNSRRAWRSAGAVRARA